MILKIIKFLLFLNNCILDVSFEIYFKVYKILRMMCFCGKDDIIVRICE